MGNTSTHQNSGMGCGCADTGAFMRHNYDEDYVRALVGGEPWRPGTGLITDRAAFAARNGMSLANLSQQLTRQPNGRRVELSLAVVQAAQAEAGSWPVYSYLMAVEATRMPAGGELSGATGGDLGFELLLRLTDLEGALGRYAESLGEAVAEESDGGPDVTRHELAVLEPLAVATYERTGEIVGRVRQAREVAERPRHNGRKRRVG